MLHLDHGVSHWTAVGSWCVGRICRRHGCLDIRRLDPAPNGGPSPPGSGHDKPLSVGMGGVSSSPWGTPGAGAAASALGLGGLVWIIGDLCVLLAVCYCHGDLDVGVMPISISESHGENLVCFERAMS